MKIRYQELDREVTPLGPFGEPADVVYCAIRSAGQEPRS